MRLGCGFLVLATLASALIAAQTRRYHNALLLARSETAVRRFDSAAVRLEGLLDTRPLWNSTDAGEVPYLLGFCRWNLGRQAEALAAFARVPATSTFSLQAAPYLAEGELNRGQWRAAEERLERAFENGAGSSRSVLAALERVYRMEARFEDAARLVRARIADAPADAPAGLRDLWRTERGTPPFEAIAAALDIAAGLNPDDERVWLGRARVATQMGRLDEADAWLKRCEAKRPDAAVWFARLDWSRAADRPREAARALRELEDHPALDRRVWRAWFAQHSGDPPAEVRSLRELLAATPRDPRWLSRLAALEPGSAPALNRTKAEVDRALDAYTQLMARPTPPADLAGLLSSARLAADAGRPFDAQVWLRLAQRLDPANRDVRDALAKLESQPLRAAPNASEPWHGASLIAAEPGTPETVLSLITFTDDARAAGLTHLFQNGETLIRQMPVALSGGIGLLDVDGDSFLDIYCLQGGAFPPEPSRAALGDRLFRNRGDGSFEDVTERSGIAGFSRGYGHGVAVGDVDNDGHADLFITRWRSYALYRNKGDGAFEDVTERYGLGGDRDWPTSAAFADLDGDGDLDLYVCHYVEWDEVHPRLCRNGETNAFMSCDPKSCRARPDHLFRNDGGRYTDISESSGVRAVDLDGRGLGVVAADLDDDGRIDLFVANDKSANFLFRNLGGLKFDDVAHSAGVAGNAEGGYQAGMGVACGDLDGDGRLDLVVTNYYGESTTYYHNEGGGLFTDRTVASGLGAASRLRLGFGAVLLDVDNDGRLDLVTANGHTDDLGDTPYRMPAQLLRGVGRGRLVDLTESAGKALATPRVGRGLAEGDLDNDGRLDLLLVGQNDHLAWLHNRTQSPGQWVAFELQGTRSNRSAVGTLIRVDAGGVRRLMARCGGGSYLSAGEPRMHLGLGPSIKTIDGVEVRWPSGQVDRYRDLAAGVLYKLVEGDAAPKPVPGRPTPKP